MDLSALLLLPSFCADVAVVFSSLPSGVFEVVLQSVTSGIDAEACAALAAALPRAGIRREWRLDLSGNGIAGHGRDALLTAAQGLPRLTLVLE